MNLKPGIRYITTKRGDDGTILKGDILRLAKDGSLVNLNANGWIDAEDIEEAMKGDPTLFAREDSVLESWRIVEQILTDYPPVERYEQGSWGPSGALALMRSHGGWPSEPPISLNS
jgi:hypothetical protein